MYDVEVIVNDSFFKPFMPSTGTTNSDKIKKSMLNAVNLQSCDGINYRFEDGIQTWIFWFDNEKDANVFKLKWA